MRLELRKATTRTGACAAHVEEHAPLTRRALRRSRRAAYHRDGICEVHDRSARSETAGRLSPRPPDEGRDDSTAR